MQGIERHRFFKEPAWIHYLDSQEGELRIELMDGLYLSVPIPAVLRLPSAAGELFRKRGFQIEAIL